MKLQYKLEQKKKCVNTTFLLEKAVSGEGLGSSYFLHFFFKTDINLKPFTIFTPLNHIRVLHHSKKEKRGDYMKQVFRGHSLF